MSQSKPASNIAAKVFSVVLLLCVIGCGGLGVLVMLLPGLIGLSEPTTKVEGKAPRQSVKESLLDDQTPTDKARQILQDDYLKFLRQEFSLTNITIEVQLTPGGYRLYGVHASFTAKTFATGPEAKVVNRWIEGRISDLKKARITRVGVRNDGPLGECGYDIKQSD